jgi:predicted metalloprotease
MYTSILRLLLMTGMLARAVGGAEITEGDLRQMQAKLALANRYLESTWREFFPLQNAAAPMPRVVAYRRQVLSGCGTLGPRNAYFCSADNTVYYDEVFLTELAKAAGVAIRTNGDYAAVAALAHELGHAVRFRQQSEACRRAQGMIAAALICSPNPFESEYLMEAQADCYSGAVTKRFGEGHLLLAGDIQAAQFILGSLGDLGQRDDSIERSLMTPPHSHGEGAARRKHFELGYKGGANACRDSSQVIANDGIPAPRQGIR